MQQLVLVKAWAMVQPARASRGAFELKEDSGLSEVECPQQTDTHRIPAQNSNICCMQASFRRTSHDEL